MTPAPPPLSLRRLTSSLGSGQPAPAGDLVERTQAIRAEPIAETAERERRRAGLAAEAARLARDPAYVREALGVARLMEELRGPR